MILVEAHSALCKTKLPERSERASRNARNLAPNKIKIKAERQREISKKKKGERKWMKIKKVFLSLLVISHSLAF